MATKKTFDLSTFNGEFEPGKTTLSSMLKNDHENLYLKTHPDGGGFNDYSPFTFATDGLEELKYKCIKDGCKSNKLNHNTTDHSFTCKIHNHKRKIDIKKKCFTCSELVKDLDISTLLGKAYYVVSDIKKETEDKERVRNSIDETNPRLPCGLVAATAGSLLFGIEELQKWHSGLERSIRLLRIFNNHDNELVKVFFIYEESDQKDKKRVFIPFRNKEAQANIKADAKPLLESKSADTSGGRRRSSRKYKKRTRRIKSKSSYNRFRRYRK